MTSPQVLFQKQFIQIPKAPLSAAVQDSSEDEGKAKGKKNKGKRGAKHTSSKGQRFAAIKRGSGGKQKGGAMKTHKGANGKASRPGAKAGGKGKGRK